MTSGHFTVIGITVKACVSTSPVTRYASSRNPGGVLKIDPIDQRDAEAGLSTMSRDAKRWPWILIGGIALVVLLAAGGLGAWLFLHQPRQIVLPFPGVREPYGVAVDTAGNVFVADVNNNRVLKLPAA
jgi:DNA-binding beta-propeller fold protein YncE